MGKNKEDARLRNLTVEEIRCELLNMMRSYGGESVSVTLNHSDHQLTISVREYNGEAEEDEP